MKEEGRREGGVEERDGRETIILVDVQEASSGVRKVLR
jgi:hypothetical protein